jgi:antitoxin ParD1/3/4
MDYRKSGEPTMTVRKQTVSFTEPAFAYARSLVDTGEYPSVSAAVSGEMVRAKAAREARAAVLAAEVERRLALPLDRWEPVGELSEVTGEARARLAELRRLGASRGAPPGAPKSDRPR